MPTLELTPGESDHVALAQEKRNKLVSDGLRIAQEGEAVLRRAVERIFNDHKASIPTGNVNIANGQDGAPAAFTWEEAPAPAASADTGEEPSSDEPAGDAEPVVEKAVAPKAATNGAKPAPAAKPPTKAAK